MSSSASPDGAGAAGGGATAAGGGAGVVAGGSRCASGLGGAGDQLQGGASQRTGNGRAEIGALLGHVVARSNVPQTVAQGHKAAPIGRRVARAEGTGSEELPGVSLGRRQHHSGGRERFQGRTHGKTPRAPMIRVPSRT